MGNSSDVNSSGKPPLSTRAKNYLYDEIERLKGIKGEMAERGKLNIVLRIIGPVIIYFIFLGVLRLLVGPEAFPEVLGAVILYLVAVGKEMVAPIGAGLVEAYPTVSMPLMVLALAFDDIICAMWMVLNWKVIKFIPFIGRFFDNIEKNSQKTVEEKKWLGKFSTVGLALLVTFPMRGSGGIFGPVIGKILGLSGRNIFLAVVVGGIAGFSILVPAFYYAMEPIQRFFGVTTTWGVTAIMVAIVVTIVLASWLIQKRRKGKQATT